MTNGPMHIFASTKGALNPVAGRGPEYRTFHDLMLTHFSYYNRSICLVLSQT